MKKGLVALAFPLLFAGGCYKPEYYELRPNEYIQITKENDHVHSNNPYDLPTNSYPFIRYLGSASDDCSEDDDWLEEGRAIFENGELLPIGNVELYNIHEEETIPGDSGFLYYTPIVVYHDSDCNPENNILRICVGDHYTCTTNYR